MIKHFFYKFFSYIYKHVNKILSEKTNKGFKKRPAKGIKIFLKEKKKCQYAPKRYGNLSEEEKDKKLQHGREQYRNLPEDDKQRLLEYRKK